MKKNMNNFTKISFCFSVASLILGGILYFSTLDTTIFYKVIMIVQNSISAFGGDSVLKITEFYKVLNSDNLIHLIVGYIYALGIVVAPLCTVSFIYDILQKLLYFGNLFNLKGGKKVLVFGYNNVIKNWIKNLDKKTDYKIYIISQDNLSDEDVELINKKHVLLCVENYKNEYEKKELMKFIKHQKICKNDKIILFYNSDVDNYLLLSLLLNENELLGGADIFVHCENDVIKERIDYKYINYKSEKLNENIVNVEVFDINQKLINTIFDKNPIFECFGDNHSNLNIHYLIIGLGGTGIEFLLQAIHLSVFSSNNRIVFDIFDKNIEERKLELLNHFSKTVLSIKNAEDMKGKNTYTIGNGMFDGELVLNFYNFDSKYKPAAMCMRELNDEKNPINIAMISLGDVNDTYIAVNNLVRTLNKLNRKNNVLIYTKVDSYSEKQVYFSDYNDNENFKLIPFYKEQISLDNIINDDVLKKAMEFNHQYETVTAKTLYGSNKEIENKETMWKKIEFTYKKLSSIALSLHNKIKGWIYEDLKKEELNEYAKIVNNNSKDTNSFINALTHSDFLNEFCKMEHRRWCYFMATNGWSNLKNDNIDKNNKNVILHSHVCMVNWEQLKANPNTNNTCIYDAMWIMLNANKF